MYAAQIMGAVFGRHPPKPPLKTHYCFEGRRVYQSRGTGAFFVYTGRGGKGGGHQDLTAAQWAKAQAGGVCALGGAGEPEATLLGGSEKTHHKAALALVVQAGNIEKQLERGMPACGKDSIEALAEVARIYGGLRQEALYLKGGRRNEIDHKARMVWSQVLRPLAAHVIQNCMR